MSNSIIPIKNQIEYLEIELQKTGEKFKKEIESGKSNREDCLVKYRIFQSAISTLKIAAGGAIATFIKELSEMDGDTAQMKLTLVTVMQENARLITDNQEKQNLINVLHKFYPYSPENQNENPQSNQVPNTTANS